MTQSASDTDALRALRDRNTLVRAVRIMLKGRGLDIRELANELVISHPGHPEYGRIYITYARWEVSHRRTVWEYLGYLGDNVDANADSDRCVDVHTIIKTLTGRAGTFS